MAVYVDNYRASFNGGTYSHMMADTVEELHAMADKIGLKHEWFQPKSRAHYDVSESKRALAVKHGAIQMTAINLAKWNLHKDKHGRDVCPVCNDDKNIYHECCELYCVNCGWDSTHWDKYCRKAEENNDE